LPDVVRYVREPITIAGYEIPVGTFLTPCIHLAHRRPETWADPGRFLPERFKTLTPDGIRWIFFPDFRNAATSFSICLRASGEDGVFGLIAIEVLVDGMTQQYIGVPGGNARFRRLNPSPVFD